MLLETNDSYASPADYISFAPVGNAASRDREIAARQAEMIQPTRRRMGAAIECYISAHLGRLS